MTAPTSAGRYNPDDPALRYGVPVRHAALTSAAAGIRVRRGGRFPVEQVLLAAAAILFPLGLAVVLLGWYGAAHNGHTYAQIDYLISGGIFGLGVSVAGGFMYFGYWLSRQLNENRRNNGLTIQSLQRIEDLLEAVLDTRAAAYAPAPFAHTNGHAAPAAVPLPVPVAVSPAASAPTAAAAAVAAPGATEGRRSRSARPRTRAAAGAVATGAALDATGEVPAVDGPVLVATPRGSLLHRPDCPVVARRSDLRAVAAGTEGFGYCTMCDAAEVLS